MYVDFATNDILDHRQSTTPTTKKAKNINDTPTNLTAVKDAPPRCEAPKVVEQKWQPKVVQPDLPTVVEQKWQPKVVQPERPQVVMA